MSSSNSYLTRHPERDFAIRSLFEDDITRLEEALEIETAGEQASSSGDPSSDLPQLPSRYRQMLDRLRDPNVGLITDAEGKRIGGTSITRIMKECGLKATEVMDVIRKRDIALAVLNSGKHIYQMLDDMGEDAKSRIVTCRRCDGEGNVVGKGSIGNPDDGEEEIAAIEQCEDCDGTGKLRKVGDPVARKLLLEVHGLKKSDGSKSATANVNVGVGVGVSVKGEKAEGRQESVTARVGRILDAEVISK